MKFKKLLALVGVASLGFMAVPSAAFAADGDTGQFSTNRTVTVPADGTVTYTTMCADSNSHPEGGEAIDGRAEFNETNSHLMELVSEGLTDDAGGWTTTVYNGDTQARAYLSWVDCVPIPQPLDIVAPTFTAVNYVCDEDGLNVPGSVTTGAEEGIAKWKITLESAYPNGGHAAGATIGVTTGSTYTTQFNSEAGPGYEGVITARPVLEPGYTFGENQSEFTFTFVKQDCRTVVVPAEVEVTQPMCEANEDGPGFTVGDGSVTIPNRKGVTYVLNGEKIPGGQATTVSLAVGNHTLTAFAKDGYKFEEEFSQDIEMIAPVCMTPLEPSTPIEPTVPDEPVVVPPADDTPAVTPPKNPIQRFPSDTPPSEKAAFAPTSPVLASTGFGMAVPLLAGLGALGTGAGLLFRRRK